MGKINFMDMTNFMDKNNLTDKINFVMNKINFIRNIQFDWGKYFIYSVI